jgi:hypothetical protein
MLCLRDSLRSLEVLVLSMVFTSTLFVRLLSGAGLIDVKPRSSTLRLHPTTARRFLYVKKRFQPRCFEPEPPSETRFQRMNSAA